MDAALTAKKRRHRNERIAATILVLLVAGITGGMIWWKDREERAIMTDFRYIPRETPITPEIELLREYVRIDTSTVAGEAEGARWLAAELRERGIEPELIEAPEGRLNVYARIKGATPGGGLLLFNHIDVMPAGKGWTHAPFDGAIAVNMLHGRGTLDMKALAICQLLAVADVARSGRPPVHDLVFLATADEETGSKYGMRWLLDHRPDIFEGIGFGITEGGLTEMISEKMTYFGIEIGGKQLVAFDLIAGDQESLQRARLALEPHMISREPTRILPEVRDQFRGLAPTRTRYKEILADIDASVAGGDFWDLPISYRDLTQNTLWVSAPARSGDHWIMGVKMVNLPDEIPDERIEWMRRFAAPFGVRLSDVTIKEGPVPLSPSNTRLFTLLTAEAKERYQVSAGVQVLYRTLSDSRFLRTRGIVCYGVSPYPVDYFQSISIHQPNERIRLDFYLEGVGYFRNVIAAWAAE